jgi:hypothetical protein
MHVIDRNSGYEYELGCNNPPPVSFSGGHCTGTITMPNSSQKTRFGLIDNVYPYRDQFLKLDHVVFAVEDDDFGPSLVCLQQNVKPKGFNSKAIVIGRKV